ncbi:hypothetical protein F2P56_033514 [Juglans regia]|uniref:Uncharacterized protein LOC109001649 n=2 Tax=Juglans regia TaxID=51240 RepID=A0A2I4FSC6_JUGRE|nr:uncharacterized protein LOC109001649 [Juglans regia]KAF5448006.1 hypothetical protein F2P56_033514 [Juglans regia]
MYGWHSNLHMHMIHKNVNFILPSNTYLKKDSTTPLAEHLRIFKNLCDNLASIGRPVADKMKVFSLLNGLGAQYEPFTTTMLKPPMPSYTEIIPLLQGYEILTTLHEINPTFAFYGQQTGTSIFNDHCGGGRGDGRAQPRSFTSRGQGFHPTSYTRRERDPSYESGSSHGPSTYSRATSHDPLQHMSTGCYDIRSFVS